MVVVVVGLFCLWLRFNSCCSWLFPWFVDHLFACAVGVICWML